MGLTNLPSLDDLIKYTRPLWHDADEHRITINKSIQCRGQLPISSQTIEASSKPIFMSPEVLQKGSKAIIKAPMARNRETIYIYTLIRDKPGTFDSPKSIHRYSNISNSLIIL